MSLRRASADESAVGKGFRWARAEPVITHRVALRQSREHGKHLGRKNTHDAVCGGPGKYGPLFFRLPAQRVAEVGDKALICCDRRYWSIDIAEELRVCCGVSLSGVGSGHVIRVRVRSLNF